MQQERILKKYPNRRLYDTTLSRYVTQEAVRLLTGEVLRVADFPPEGGEQVGAVELHVVEHLGDGVPMHQVGHLVALVGEPDVDGVGVAEEVVQVAQDLLVGTGEKDAED